MMVPPVSGSSAYTTLMLAMTCIVALLAVVWVGGVLLWATYWAHQESREEQRIRDDLARCDGGEVD